MAKRNTIAYARRGNVEASGRTKTEAKAELESQIDWLCAEFYPHIEKRYNVLIFIHRTSTGWTSKVLDPADMKHGAVAPWCTFQGKDGFAEVLEANRYHAAQLSWHHTADDTAHIEAAGLDKNKAADLARWITFQRNYKKAKAAGASDSEAFNMAHGYQPMPAEKTEA